MNVIILKTWVIGEAEFKRQSVLLSGDQEGHHRIAMYFDVCGLRGLRTDINNEHEVNMN